jgi:hypothetical protein
MPSRKRLAGLPQVRLSLAMPHPLLTDKLRLASIALGVAAILPFAWALWASDRYVDAQQAQRGWACGMPVLAMYIWALILATPVSLVATVLGLRGYRQLPAPRSAMRRIELAATALPLAFALTLAALLVALLGAGA